jgi:hypothetical protein
LKDKFCCGNIVIMDGVRVTEKDLNIKQEGECTKERLGFRWEQQVRQDLTDKEERMWDETGEE